MNHKLLRAVIAVPARRRAFELGFATSYLCAGARPTFVRVGEITFQRPVEVGDLLRLQSTVLHTSHSADGTTVRSCARHSPLLQSALLQTIMVVLTP